MKQSQRRLVVEKIMSKITIEINSDIILTEILERDGELHAKIKRKVEERLIDDLVAKIEDKYIKKSWRGEEEIANNVLDHLAEQQTELVKKILREFYDSYRYKKSDLSILKALKKFLDDHE